MRELQVKAAGYPELLRDTGAQSPLQGPLFTLSSMIMPVYSVGNSTVQPGQDFPFPFANVSIAQQVSPVAGTVLNLTGILPRGWYAFKLWGYAASTAALGVFNRLQIRLWDGFTAVQAERMIFLEGTDHKDLDRRWIQFLPGNHELQFFNENNFTGEISSSLRWAFLGVDFDT